MEDLYTPKILHDLPIKTSEEAQFQFDAYASTLARMILAKSTKTPIVVGLYGRWGSGKTTLLQLLKAKLTEFCHLDQTTTLSPPGSENINQFRACKTIWFNAWKYAREEEILVSLIEQIRREMYQEKGFIERMLSKTQEFAAKYNLTEALANGFSQFITGGLVSLDLSHYGETSPLRRNFVLHNEFQVMFDELVAEFTRRSEDGILVVLIDDLDRCLPSKVMQILEAVKLFVDSGGCAFVIGADPKMITAAIQSHYSAHGMQDVSPRDYIDKIVQVHFDIPPLRPEDAAGFIAKLPTVEAQAHNLLRLLASSIPTNPRKIKTFINHVEIQWATMVNTGLHKGATKEGLIQWLVLNEACPGFCDRVKALDSDVDKVGFISHVREFAKASPEEREDMRRAEPQLDEFGKDEMLLDILTQGSFAFSPIAIGSYIHFSPPPLIGLAEDAQSIIDGVLADLTAREEWIVRLAFGLGDVQACNMADIARQMGVHRNTVRKWLATALRRLRHPSHSRKLRMVISSRRPIDPAQEDFMEAVFGEGALSR